jgi:hypothetical protein
MLNLLHASLADIPEGELVAQLMQRPLWRADLLNFKGFPDNANDYQNVPLTGLPGDPEGDIDILLCEPNSADRPTVVQVKRVKIGPNTFATGKPNKLSEFSKAVEQTNLLAKIGFWQVYLFMFVVVDSRAHNEGKISYAGLTPELSEKMRAFFSVSGLDPGAGLVVFELVQPMDFAPLSTGSGATQLIRLGETISVQPDAVTAWVNQQVAIRKPNGPPSQILIPAV